MCFVPIHDPESALPSVLMKDPTCKRKDVITEKIKKSSRCTMSALYKINQKNSHINMHKGVRVPCVQKITKPFYGI